MKTKIILIALTAAALVGCGNSNNGHGKDMAGDGGVAPDLTPPADMTDITPIPAPTATHVGASGTTSGLVTAGADAAAYLLNPTGTPATGALHVVGKDGTDKAIDTGVPMGGYALGADGKSIVYTKAAGQAASLYWADTTAATIAPKLLVNGTVPTTALGQVGFYAPSGHYFIIGVLAPNVSRSLDFKVFDTRTGADVYDRGNGAFDYLELVLPDDTMVFQDTAGGTSTGTTPVQTLYWVALPNATAAPAAAITTHTSTFTPTADNKTLIIQKTSGDLLAWDLTAKSGAGTTIASGVVKFTIGGGADGPIAYLGADGSVHVVKTDGSKVFDLAASKTTAADLFGPVVLAADARDVYYFQNVETQENRGTLMRAPVMSGATPSKVGDKISIADVQVMDDALVLLQNVDDLGQFGDAVVAQRDGSGLTPLGMKVPVGALQAVNPGPDTWFALHLGNAAIDMTNVPIDGSPPLTGKLMWADYTGAAELTLDATAHQGAFAFSDDGRDAVYVSGVAWNATAMNFAGSLKFLATRAPGTAIDGMLAGVTELGPVVSRALFVNAPLAPTPGVYYVTY